MRGGRWDRALAVGAGTATILLLGFVALPVIAVFVRVSPHDLLAQLHSKVALDALAVSLRSSVVAVALILLAGTPAAYVLATRRFRGAAAVTTLLELPLVLPPPVAGIGLLAAFGRAGLLGGAFRTIGITIPFTEVAVVMALTFVALPFYMRQAVAAFASVDPDLLSASRTLGVGTAGTFVRVALPLARPGLAAGAALAWARTLGEFGATLMFAGSLPGKTQTLPVAIYVELSQSFHAAVAIAALLVATSAGLLVAVKLLLPRTVPLLQPWTLASGQPSTFA